MLYTTEYAWVCSFTVGGSFYFVAKLILLSNFVENCGIFLIEIGFLKALYMGLSQMIKYFYHFLLDNISIYKYWAHMWSPSHIERE